MNINLFLKFLVINIVFAFHLLYANDNRLIDTLTYNYVVSNPARAKIMLLNYLNDKLKNGIDEKYAKAYSFLGLSNYFLGDFTNAIDSYFKAINIYEQYKNYNEIAANFGEIGYQLKRYDIEKAEEYMRKGIYIAREKKVFLPTYIKLIDNYGVIKEFKKQYDSAAYFYQEALKLKKIINDNYGIPYTLNKLANLAIITKEFKLAKSYINESDRYRNKIDNIYDKLDNKVLWGDLYYATSEYDIALDLFLSSLEIARKNNYAFIIEYCLNKIYQIYEIKRDYNKSFHYFKEYKNFKDSIDNIKVKNNIAQIEIAYQTEKKNDIIKQQNLEISRQRILIISVTLVLILIFMLVFFVYFYQRKLREQEKEELELKNKLLEAELNTKIANEKLRIARELHDNIGARLTIISSNIEILLSKADNFTKEKLKSLKDFCAETLKDLRIDIWSIKNNSAYIDELVEKIKNYLGKLDNKDLIKYDIELDNNFALSSLEILNIFRIVQEAIQNALKYAAATEILLKIQCENPATLTVIIQDNGIGFDTHISSGNGLINMPDRAKEINALFDLYSEPNKGTKITLKLKK